MTKHYLCGVNYKKYQTGTKYYDSIDDLKNNMFCWDECGIVEIVLDESGNEVSHKWLVPQDL